ncbi:ATPase, P-type (transporting), HAD superfamily, subfamily IC [Chlorobium limicola DSM 245]|uniref:ATPase, P-type (Transporting), HAD superfamily, subfamily IC n=1 Tax=Chlorobium limicola (strain DSM 245 / NBRC 103803 / 6330) TaxID=290315 RepID=B3EDM3_CHLL2|nr:cation-translocating P-type ATPase [Chlorobium limicola]ACD90648.1 ATPase, P-type (transporting), HAD superfamily, subfamily IC [Chlorobium limicola DSM 245]
MTNELWHTLTSEAVLGSLGVTSSGLGSAEADRRIRKYGPNILQSKKGVSPWRLLLDQFKNVLILTLLLATVLSAFLGHGLEAVAITVIVLFAVLLGFIQEFRAEKAIDALRSMAAPQARVIRDGREQLVPASEVVPGDMVMLAAGDRIPADARLVVSVNLQVEEASLTGESLPSGKDAGALSPGNAGIGDRGNMVFAGTAVSYGRGSAVVVATGMQTEFGRIAALLQRVETEKTPLQKNLDKVGAALARAALVIVLVIVALGLFRGQSFIDMLIFGIALAVAVVPEALPAVVTISLALGVQRMVKRNALMRRLPVVETLGSTTVICSDKTGTLTRDEMTVRALYTSGLMVEVGGSGYIPQGGFTVAGDGPLPDSLFRFLTAGVLCSDARLLKNEEGEWDIKGDPTEGALLVAAVKAGLDIAELQARFPRLDEQPFSSETKRMITLHDEGGAPNAFIKGAPEVILQDSATVMMPEALIPLDTAMKERLLAEAEAMGRKALRVLALAENSVSSIGMASVGMTFLGFAGMIDPPRPEAAEAVQRCIEAGIRPVMITGDHPVTAEAIARELGILRDGRVVEGTALQEMSDEELRRSVDGISVFARVAPEHKLRIVDALQKNGEIVAMTGDGVNDAPALKKADIGISMGITGTDVSKEASAMMLTDDNFASIVAAVEEGRGIYDNIRKYLIYLLSSNIGELGLMAGASLFGMPLPLTAVQILYVNLATDGLPALALAVDPPEKDIMKRRPNDPRQGIFTRPVLALMLAGGIWSTLVNLSLFNWALHSGRPVREAMTMTFVSLVLIQFFKAYNFRSETRPLYSRPFANRWLNLAILWELILLVLIIAVPFLRIPFSTFCLTAEDWLIVLLSSLTVVPVIELVKLMIRKGVIQKDK